MTKQSLAVSTRGELVILCIGNTELSMPYAHALQISEWIREEAGIAKRAAGRAKTVRSLGVLHDATAKAKPLPYTAGTAIHSKPKLLAWHREDVSLTGRVVSIRINGTTIGLHFENALRVAQWLRVRGKQAKRVAGDNERRWHEIARLEDLRS